MVKTAKQIQGDVYRLLKDSTLYSMISGEVYRSGQRPRDSRMEDAVVIFTSGFPTQIQTGVVTVNIFVPDIAPFDNGVLTENSGRTEQLEILAQEWVDSLTAGVSNYSFELNETIDTDADEETHQHFVVVKLRYRYFGDDNAPPPKPRQSKIDVTVKHLVKNI